MWTQCTHTHRYTHTHTHSGVQLQTSDHLLRHYSNKRLNGQEKLEMRALIQNAKFQAKIERQRQKIKKTSEINEQLHAMRNGIVMHFLR